MENCEDLVEHFDSDWEWMVSL